MFTDEELSKEEWRPVVGWESYYSVSSLGRVKRLERTIAKPNGGTKTLPEKLVATKPNADGFVSVLLRVGDRRSVTTAHRLVAAAFITNEMNYRFIAHLNGIGYDNRVENLVWVKRPRDAKTSTRSLEKDYDRQCKSMLDEHTLPGEEWRDIDGYVGLYLVSNFGRVFSVPRPKAKAGVLNPATAANGYQHVTLCKNGETTIANIHRLVAEAFLDAQEGKPIVNHRDEDKTNNFAQNLEWCTYEYNSNYGTAQERMVAGRDYVEIGKKISAALKGRTDIKRRSKPVLQFGLDGNLLHRWNSVAEASRSLGISTNSIGGACNRGVHWRNGISCGYRWDFEGVDYDETA